jgi:hypothetical protein
MSKEVEWVPWYRRKDYKGDLTEEEKRLLDGFRPPNHHPAQSVSSLSESVTLYISSLELEVYDRERQSAFGKAFGGTLCLALLGFLAHRSGDLNAYWIAFGTAFTVLLWVEMRLRTRKAKEALFPPGEGAPSALEAAIQQNWDLDYIYNHRRGINSKR